MALRYSELSAHYQLAALGLIHGGAHLGQEYADYKTAGVERLLFFEPQPHIFRELQRRLGDRPDVLLVDRALGPVSGIVSMHVEDNNQGMSSSVLPPSAAMTAQYPAIRFPNHVDVQQVTLDEFLASASIYSVFDALVLDVQGFELAVLQGGNRLLEQIGHVITEVSRVSLYQGGALVHEIDSFLEVRGFFRAETFWEGGTWGDALYLRSPLGAAPWPRIRQSQTCQIPNLGAKFAEVFGNYRRGTFVEIGAFDGEAYSNTCGLADNGWKGVYVEPVSDFANRCRLRHQGNSVEIVVAAIGEGPGEACIGLAGEYSSTMRAHMEVVAALDQRLSWSRSNDRPTTNRWWSAPQVSLDGLLTQCNITPGFELLVVDIEGGEWDALHNFPWSTWMPQMAIIELPRRGNLFAGPDALTTTERLTDRIIANGYEVHWFDAINTIFRRRM